MHACVHMCVCDWGAVNACTCVSVHKCECGACTCECGGGVHAHVCTGLVQLMAQLLNGVLGPEWALWQVPSGEPGVWPRSHLWCLVDVVGMVGSSKVGRARNSRLPSPRDSEGLEGAGCAGPRAAHPPGGSVKRQQVVLAGD